jgi:hypothetical protein
LALSVDLHYVVLVFRGNSILCCALQIRYLGAIGGKDIAETTRRVLRSVMANSVAQKMNFIGRGQKTGIQQMRLLQVVIGKHALQFVCSL